MKRSVSRLRFQLVRAASHLVIPCMAALLGLPGTALLAQDPNPADWDLEIRSDKATAKAGDALAVTSGIVSRKEGVQGWSYGVKHDTSVLTIESVTVEGTDVPGLFSNGFDQTTLIEQGGQNVGYIQAIILSFVSPVVVPASEYFEMAAASYKVKAGACDGKTGSFKTKIEYTDTLAVPNSPPVDINLTIAGKAVVPTKIGSREVTVECEGIVEGGLALKFDQAVTDLVADRTAVHDLKVQIRNTKTSGGFDVQGWSYGVQIDTAKIEAIRGEAGADSKALQGGKGPDFINYSLNDQNAAGTVKGVTVGAVIELDAPGTAVLAVGAGATKHIDTIQLRSKIDIAAGSPAQTTDIKFVDSLGGDRPLEVLIVVAGEGIVPDFSDTKTLNLLPKGDAGKPRFIRGDANNDARLDIADGIWIINELFYAGPKTACKGAADANADAKNDIADAMYIFQYQLQPGATPGNLFPRPPAPFPGCGTAAGVELADCPAGSTTCP